jgi:hypothetical protein
MFYGIIYEDYVYEDYILQEIDFKGAIDTVKKKVKNAILSFIRKIESFLSKGKDNKIKSALRSSLQKVRKLLGDTENIETEADAKKINKEIEKYREEYDKITEWEATGIITMKMVRDWFKEKQNLLDNPSKYNGVIVYKHNVDESKLSNINKGIFEMLNMDDNDICLIVCEKNKPSKFIFKKNFVVDEETSIDSILQMKMIENGGWFVMNLQQL